MNLDLDWHKHLWILIIGIIKARLRKNYKEVDLLKFVLYLHTHCEYKRINKEEK